MGASGYRAALTVTLVALVGTVFWAQTSSPQCEPRDAHGAAPSSAAAQPTGAPVPPQTAMAEVHVEESLRTDADDDNTDEGAAAAQSTQAPDRTPVDEGEGDSAGAAEAIVMAQPEVAIRREGGAAGWNHDDGAYPPQRDFRRWLRGAWRQSDSSILSGAHTRLKRCLQQGLSGEGHSAQLQVETKTYMTIARRPEVKRICEIGFNMGHSASTWLGSNPNAEVIMFDLWKHGCAPTNERWLRSPKAAGRGLRNVSQRLRIIKGSSLETVPKFFAENPDIKCNVISVDGGHTREIAVLDIRNMRMLADPDFHVLLVDDTNGNYRDVDLAVEDHLSRGTIRRILGYAEMWDAKADRYERGLTVLQYVLNDPQWRTTMTPHLRGLRFMSYDQVDDAGYLQVREQFNRATKGTDALTQRPDLVRQRAVQIKLARMPGVQKVCIIRNRVPAHLGQDVFPALVWLWANPNVEVLQLAAVDGEADTEAEAWVRSDAAQTAGLVNASARLKVVKQGGSNGPYNSIVGKYTSGNDDKCNVIIVEGSSETTTQKLLFLQTLADVDHNVLVVENTNCDSKPCTAAMAALDGLETLRVITPPFLSLEDANGAAGITVASFI